MTVAAAASAIPRQRTGAAERTAVPGSQPDAGDSGVGRLWSELPTWTARLAAFVDALAAARQRARYARRDVDRRGTELQCAIAQHAIEEQQREVRP